MEFSIFILSGLRGEEALNNESGVDAQYTLHRNTWLRDRRGLDYVNNTYILKCRATKYASSNRRRVCYVCPILDGTKERVLTNFEVERLAYRRRVGKNEVLITEKEAERHNLID